MTSEEYCFEKAAPVGSAFYYGLQKLSSSERGAIVAIAALYQELNDILYECHDPALAFVKFNWWRGEILKLKTGKSDHPVILTLQKHSEKFHLEPQPFLNMLEGVEQGLNLSPFLTFEEVTLHIIHTTGAREFLMAKVLTRNEIISPENIYSFSLVIALVEYIQHLRRNVARGFVLFGEDELNRFKVTPLMLQSLKTTPEVRQLLDYQFEKIERARKQALQELAAPARQLLNPLILRAEIGWVILQEIKASDYSVMENLITITPLRMWWISYKTRLFSL
jgi:phytoene synthase